MLVATPAWAQTLATTRPAEPAAAAARPNIVLVLIDDMGYGDLRCYDPAAAPTPNIDRLAREGVRFTQYYSNAPICSPSRCAILTGQYPQRHRVTSYIAARAENEARGIAHWLDPAAPSLARTLRASGYATGHFGKWHLGGGRDVGEAPLITEYGFDASLTQFEGLGDRLLPVLDAVDGRPAEPMGLGLASEKLGRGTVTRVDRSRVTGAFVERAITFIDQARAAGRPFYVNLWPDDVHSPFFPPAALRTREGKRALYRATVRAMDAQLGQLFDHLRDDAALRDNTLVVLTSDNGPEPGAGTAGRFRGAKGLLYEGGVREPLIVWSPGRVAPAAVGSTDSASVIAGIDLAPTLSAIAGATPMAATATGDALLDGLDVSDALLGRARLERATPLFWRRPPDRPGPANGPFPDLSMRQGNWKLLCMADGSSPQLYDLSADVGEADDRAAHEPARVRAMTAALLAWNATLPTDKPAKPRPVATTTAE